MPTTALRPDRRLLTFCDTIAGVQLDAAVLDGLTMTFADARTIQDRRDGAGRLRLRYSCHGGQLTCDPTYDVLTSVLPAFRPLGLRADVFVAVWVPFPTLQSTDGSRLSTDLAAGDPFAAVARRTGLAVGEVPELLRHWQADTGDDSPARRMLAHAYPAQHAQLTGDQHDRLDDDGATLVGQVAGALLDVRDQVDPPAEPSLLGHGPTLVLSASSAVADRLADAAAQAGPAVQVTVGERLASRQRRLVAR